MNVISLFSGAGGLDLGFIKAGANIIWANDIDKWAVETYEKNIDNNIVLGDIKEISTDEIPNADLIIGGFPCLGFTVAKGSSRDICDEHNFLYLEYLRITEAKMPKAFLIENVPGIKRGLSFKDFFEQMINDFENLGYNIEYKTLRASHYGVPQNRDRVIIIGIRNDLNWKFNWPNETHTEKTTLTGEKPLITLKDAIGDLPDTWDEDIPNHTGTKHKVTINNYLGNRELDWDKPSPTILGRGSRSGGPVIHPHPNLKRRLTIRECARLQSFPDDFIFHGSNSACYAQIGNAVAPFFGFRIGQKMMELFGEKPHKFQEEKWKFPWNNKI
ncbi:DNA cytosine methyltransferase [Methanobrevibacter smithii]|uniref:DNA cytosine methyltransferase n=1 Tax=Methanobrevibacter smithii TaxID=2173 RepID=UPI0037DBF613